METIKVICPYCQKAAKWCNNAERYGRSYGTSHMCYWCKDCDAYVGCHQNSRIPLGTLANKELRDWRMKAHAAFDPSWRVGGLTRRQAYQHLQQRLGASKIVHIGESDIETCKKIVALFSKP